MDIKRGIPSAGISWWTLDPMVYFTKSRWAIAHTIVKFRIPALTLVERQDWRANSWKFRQASPGKPHKGMGIIVASKEEGVTARAGMIQSEHADDATEFGNPQISS